MGKLSARQMITPHSALLKWRRLIHGKLTYVSGTSTADGLYKSCIQFQEIEYYPLLAGQWNAHYIGVDFNGTIWVLAESEEQQAMGPLI